LVSHDQRSCTSNFDKLKQQFETIPKWLKPKVIANNRQTLQFTNGSKITCSCAGTKSLGRGDTLILVHISEYAFFNTPESQLNSITQALAPEGKLIIESTANGLNAFHDLYFKSANNENNYKSFFFNWIEGNSLFKKDYASAVEIYKSKHNNEMLTVKDLDDEELGLQKLGATLEQLVWRRNKVASGSLDEFHQEYPSTPIEAFISTGSSIFDNKKIINSEQAIINGKVLPIPKANIVGLPLVLANHYAKSFFMWEIPKSGEKYCIGADLSEGVGKDYSVIEVFNKESGEQVAEFINNKLKTFQMAEVIDAIGNYYNRGLVTVEKQSGGHAVLERLKLEYRYTNLTKYKSYDQFQKAQWQIGFDTNPKSKSLIINDFVEMFSTGAIKLNSRKLLNEMKIFEINENGKMAAMGTGHDDTVMSTAMALVSMKYRYWYK